MKKIVIILATCLVAICTFQNQAVAADTTFPCGSGGTYSASPGSATGSVVINSHQNCAGSVTIDKSITRIGFKAFEGSLITDIFIPDTVKYIDAWAFKNTMKLTKVRFPEYLYEIPEYIFEGSSIQEVKIPTSTGDILFSSFRGSNIKNFDYCGSETIYDGNSKSITPICQESIDAAAATQAIQDAKKLTISCVKGGVTKKVRGESPVCPKGYVNPWAKYLTFQAFSKCQLYKKDAPMFGAGLINSGKTLIIENPYVYRPGELFGDKPAQVSFQDLDCAFDYLGANDRVRDVYSYKSVKGVRTIRWGKITLRFEEGFFGLTTYSFQQS